MHEVTSHMLTLYAGWAMHFHGASIESWNKLDPKVQAFLYGPVVLAGDLGNEGLNEQMIYGTNTPRMQRLPIEVPTLKDVGGDPSSWIKPAGAGSSLTFRMATRQKEVTLMPINSIFDRRYTIYWTVA